LAKSICEKSCHSEKIRPVTGEGLTFGISWSWADLTGLWTWYPDVPVRGPIIIIMPNEDDNIDSMLAGGWWGQSFNDTPKFAGRGPINHCCPVSPLECHLIFYDTPP